MFKKLTLSIMAVGATAALLAGSTFALFSATTSNTDNTFTAGTVSLSAPMTTVVDVTNIAPGDTQADHGGAKTYSIQYTGNLEAWLGLDFAASGDLTTCDGNKFTASLSDGANSYSPSAATQVLGKKNAGDSLNLTLNWGLDLSAGNTCQGKAAQVTIAVKAVQAAHNDTGTGPIDWN